MLLFMVIFIIVNVDCKVFSESNKTVQCKNGKPLLDEISEIFLCERGCPKGFQCEQQSNISICCPNKIELSTINAAREINAQQSQNVVLVSGKPVAFQLEKRDSEYSHSCERYQYNMICDSTKQESQPQMKWYFDIQTLKCETYPLGICPDSPESLVALKSKEECESKCDVAKLNAALQKLEEPKENDVEDNNGTTTPLPVNLIEFGTFKPVVPSNTNSLIGEIAIDDVSVEAKHVRGHPLAIAIEPPTDLIHVIETPSDTQLYRRKIEKEEEDSEFLTISPENATVTSDILTVFEEIDELIDEGSGRQDEADFEYEFEVINDGKKTKASRSKLETDEFFKYNKKHVVCSKSPYKLFCYKGKPSQFVYRWEKINGICHSFPYGYCLYENNIAHPRTKAECELFCD